MAIGQVVVTRDHLVVYTESGEKQIYTRKELYSIGRGKRHWWGPWSGKISFGLTLRRGNTNQTDMNLSANIKRRTAFTRFTFDLRGAYGGVDGDVTVNNLKVDSGFDIFLSERFYVRPAEIEIYRDKFQNIDVRYSPGVAVGYTLVYNKILEWEVEAGAVYRATHYISTDPGEADVLRTGAITFGTSWESSLSKRVDFDGSYSASVGVTDAADTNQHADATLSVELTSIFDIDLTFIWDRVGQPVTTANNETPDQDDFQLVAGIGIEF
jgi:hypothetical protein